MKARFIYAASVLTAIVLGLSTRKFADHLPDFVSLHFGDAIWAAMIYLGIRFWQPSSGFRTAIVVSLIFCYLIEFSQLYQADWINTIRNTLIGALILGKGFLFIDLVRYLAGIVAAFLIDRYFLSQNRKTYGY